MNKNVIKKSAERERERERERVVNSSLEIFINKYMNTTLKFFGRFFVFALAITIFSLAIFDLSSIPVYAQDTSVFSSNISTTRTLKLSIPRIKGDDVKALQTFLNNLGYNTGTPDGSFGPKTEAGVKLFQTANNLIPDGKAGKITLSLISNISSTGGVISTSQPTLGCNPGASFNIFTGKSCTTTQLSVLPLGCIPNSLFSTTTGVSCTTGLPSSPVFQITSSGGSSGSRIQAINNPTISGVTIPAQGETPVSTLVGNNQYTATITWTGTPAVFIASTSYTATITLTPKSGYTLTGVNENFFTVAGATATNTANSGVITAVFPSTPLKQLTISSPTITTSKAYDGDTTANVTTGTLSGVSDGETVTVSATATYDDKNVGTNKDIIVIYTLGGADASHYIKPADYTISTGEITVIPLTISNPTLTTSKQYDRTTTAVVIAGSLIGKVGGDDVIVSAVATYDTPSVNTGKTITVTYSLSGLDAENYTKPVDRVVYSGTIIPKQLTITNPTITKIKLYDQSTSALVSIGTLSGVVGSEDVSISGVANYEDENVDIGKDITVVYSISGPESYNYTKPVNFEVNDGQITPIQLTIGNPTLTTSKEYDASTNATVTAGTLSGVLAGDTVTFTTEADYDNNSVGTGKTITVVYTLGGADEDNYTKPVDYVVNTGEITPILINTPAIAGVTIPSTDGIPVTSVTETDDYTGTVTWNGNPTTFENATIYTATITLTPKTGRTLTGVTENFFTVAGATATNTANSGVITAVFPETLAYATTPSSITLSVGSTNPVSSVTNVSIPNAGDTDTTGVIFGYTANTADRIKFTVTDAGSATSIITVNGGAYTSGDDYQIVPTTSFLSVVVTTTELNRTTTVRTFTITSPILGQDSLAYGMVLGADNKIWLDRNLGATRVATSYSDTQSYGHLYQWGRAYDGHQITTSGTTGTLSVSDTPSHADFIMSPSSPYDWRSPQSPNASTLWAGANGGTNNVCPAGFHVPTSAEWSTLVTAIGNFTTAGCGATSTCRETAFNSSLKIPVAGVRNSSSAALNNQGGNGGYWSSSVSGTNASSLFFFATNVYPAYAYTRALGFSVRCLKN